MSQPQALRKLMDLAARRLEIAERNLVRAQEAEARAVAGVEAAKDALKAREVHVAKARVETLDRFVGKPTRRVGVNDLLQVLKDQDLSVEAAQQDVAAAEDTLVRARETVADMSRALKDAQVAQEKRKSAFEPVIKEFARARLAAVEQEAEEEFGNARRF